MPGIAVAVIASGTEKTIISTGLMCALSCRHAVVLFKVRPDYVDLGYYGVAAGCPGRSLDSFICSPKVVEPLYIRGAVDSDIAVAEGVMGLFDGRIGDDPLSVTGSTVEAASLLGLPMTLVIDARYMLQPAAAAVHGLSTLRVDVCVSGVIINQVGSPQCADIITRFVEAMGVEALGAIPRVIGIEVSSRHLGLATAVEQGEQLEAVIESTANLVEVYVGIDWIIQLARQFHPTGLWDPARLVAPLTTQRCMYVAVTAGLVFSFTYTEHRGLLRVAEAEIVDFDPLVDELPEAEGYIMPGEPPEEYVDVLSVRDDIRRGLYQVTDDGALIHGEYTGLLWLLEGLGGCRMRGIIPGRAHMTRLKLRY